MSPSIKVGTRIIETESGRTIEDSMRNAGLLPDAFLYVVNNRPVPMDTAITDEMTVKAVKVASGG